MTPTTRLTMTRHDPADTASTDRAIEVTGYWLARQWMVASTRDAGYWFHQRSTDGTVHASLADRVYPVDGQVVVSVRPTAPKEVGELFTDGYAVESTRIGGEWVNRAVVKAGAR